MSHILIQTANALVNGKPSLESMLLAFKNKEIPLDTRWEAYTILVKGEVLTDGDGYGDGFIDTLKDPDGSEYTLYDDFYMERHETKTYPNMLESFMEWNTFDEKKKPTPESVIEWKEMVLASGNANFTNDW